jgi:hypothetical protein
MQYHTLEIDYDVALFAVVVAMNDAEPKGRDVVAGIRLAKDEEVAIVFWILLEKDCK